MRDRWPPWLFLRALGLIFSCAFASLWTQIHGLIGPEGILPARALLGAVRESQGITRYWSTPTLLWLGSGERALDLLCCAGLLAGVALLLNRRPRLAAAVATLCYLSFISVAQVFAHYQSDGMLLEAGLLAIFLASPEEGALPEAPRTMRARLASTTPRRAALWLLRWEWFCLFFESGFVKWFGGDPQWHALTALDRYYENGPLPTWLAWYAQQTLPHAFHAGTAAFTLLLENFAPLVLFLPWRAKWPRRIRLTALALCSLLQLGILATANYAFINHMALALGLLLLDDDALRAIANKLPHPVASWLSKRPWSAWPERRGLFGRLPPAVARASRRLERAAALLLFAAMFWTTLLLFPRAPLRSLPDALLAPAKLLAPFRIANRFGLFGRMTDARYELEFQGSNDGVHWTAYPFRRKPQDVMTAPGFYAPHQPRFDWNLWFAALGDWRDDDWTLNVCAALLEGRAPVLNLFAGDPFAAKPPSRCRIFKWQYWFTTPEERAATGAWWRREPRGVWAPVLEMRDRTISAQEPEP